ncbi:N-acetylmuramoyl-L-alanine amidase [Streptomyces sp. TRM68416]|nr:N-acetylmuramoyl-L-alanine amidase [Streptomyces sp. TRM68416]
MKVHYEGTAVSTRLLADHDACIAEWKAIRKSHLANKVENYSDIAYNYGACPHGYLLEGRGLGRRTGANGNAELNRAHYAILGLIGDEGLTEPTPEMLHAIRDGIELLRKHGAGTDIKGHRDGYATACPGPALYAWVQNGAPRPTPEEDPVALTVDDIKLLASKDGIWRAPKDAADYNPDPDHPGHYWSLGTHVKDNTTRIRRIDKTTAAMAAQLGALSSAVTALAAGGGLTAAEIQTAAEAGARAALAELGDKLTGD